MRLPFDYKNALYRKNNHGQPCVWFAQPISSKQYRVYHGILGKSISEILVNSSRDPKAEVKSKFNAKRKEGYKLLSEVKDNVTLPVEEGLIQYLTTYLLDYRTTIDGSVLPMLAKTFDNQNNKLFKKVSAYYAQWKINGLRCFISAHRTSGIFNEIRLKFQSREGIYWTSLNVLEDYLLSVIPDYFLDKMVEEHYILDGELYLPGYNVNEINSFVKNPTTLQNKQIQYWCYDLAIQDTISRERKNILLNNFTSRRVNFTSKEEHLNNKEKFLILPTYIVTDEASAVTYRDTFIDKGFEGLILRNPDEEYQFGKRNSSMIKFKKSTDGKFQIIDIKPEGVKRPDIPLFVCKNDINDSEFECKICGSFDYQKDILKHKEQYIGKYMHVEYGERSGVNQLPFHIKTTYIIH